MWQQQPNAYSLSVEYGIDVEVRGLHSQNNWQGERGFLAQLMSLSHSDLTTTWGTRGSPAAAVRNRPNALASAITFGSRMRSNPYGLIRSPERIAPIPHTQG